MGVDPQAASARLLEQRVAATPMTVWGESVAPKHIRLVFSNEPVERIEFSVNVSARPSPDRTRGRKVQELKPLLRRVGAYAVCCIAPCPNQVVPGTS
jgi:hypothetical protein